MKIPDITVWDFKNGSSANPEVIIEICWKQNEADDMEKAYKFYLNAYYSIFKV